ncbi:hypothetical protein KSS87_022056 [Heliosperma pusillum]|nr:hypothetical protein KSS87_022056 [Heliosperma pusillum]
MRTFIIPLLLFTFLAHLTQATCVRYCDKNVDYDVKIYAIEITPNPIARGQPAKLSISASTAKAITGGKLKIDVAYYGWHVYSENHDLCTETPCPIPTGDFVIAHSEVLPPFIIPVCIYDKDVAVWLYVSICTPMPLSTEFSSSSSIQLEIVRYSLRTVSEPINPFRCRGHPTDPLVLGTFPDTLLKLSLSLGDDVLCLPDIEMEIDPATGHHTNLYMYSIAFLPAVYLLLRGSSLHPSKSTVFLSKRGEGPLSVAFFPDVVGLPRIENTAARPQSLPVFLLDAKENTRLLASMDQV